MSLLRTSTATSRSVLARPAMNSVRYYAAGPGGSSAGATASAKGFKDREAGQERDYIRKMEVEKIQKLRDTLAKQRAALDSSASDQQKGHLDEMEAAINDLGGQSGNSKQ